jgi:ribosomal protein S18 acetylase RimI-like enzyme
MECEKTMEFRRAAESEADEVIDMYAAAVRQMNSKGIYQWDHNYPTKDILLSDIEKQCLFVIEENDQILGAIVLDEEHDKEWEEVNWTWKHEPSLNVHRLVVHPEFQGKGVAKKIIAASEAFAMENGYKQMRLDTYSKNTGAVKLYETLGYRDIGTVDFGKDALFVCFEKRLVKEKSVH